MRTTKLNTMLLAMTAIHGGHHPEPYRGSEKAKKQCLNCGKPHTHNNSYCSAECCKAHP